MKIAGNIIFLLIFIFYNIKIYPLRNVSIAFMITMPADATITPIIEYKRFFLAVSIWLSLPAAVRYWMPEMTKAMRAMIPVIPKSQVRRFDRMSPIFASESPVFEGALMALAGKARNAAINITETATDIMMLFVFISIILKI